MERGEDVICEDHRIYQDFPNSLHQFMEQKTSYSFCFSPTLSPFFSVLLFFQEVGAGEVKLIN